MILDVADADAMELCFDLAGEGNGESIDVANAGDVSARDEVKNLMLGSVGISSGSFGNTVDAELNGEFSRVVEEPFLFLSEQLGGRESLGFVRLGNERKTSSEEERKKKGSHGSEKTRGPKIYW